MLRKAGNKKRHAWQVLRKPGKIREKRSKKARTRCSLAFEASCRTIKARSRRTMSKIAKNMDKCGKNVRNPAKNLKKCRKNAGKCPEQGRKGSPKRAPQKARNRCRIAFETGTPENARKCPKSSGCP